VWTAANYTALRLDRTGQVLVDGEGNIAESQEEREAAILKGCFPKGPPGIYGPSVGGRVFEWVDVHLVSYLLTKAANTAAVKILPRLLRAA